jgi:hypothetical protein
VRGRALTDLAALGRPEARTTALNLLKTTDDESLIYAVRALGVVGTAEDLPAMIAHAESPNERLRSAVVEALGEVGGAREIPIVAARLHDSASSVRSTALSALTTLGASSARPEIVRLLEDPESEVREAAVEALRSLGTEEDVLAVEPRLADEDPDVQLNAARCLCELGSRKGVPRLLEETSGYFSLNALRAPAVWKRARERVLLPASVRRGRERLKWVSERLGLPVLGAPPASWSDPWPFVFWRTPPQRTPVRLVDVLSELRGDDDDLLFDADGIRIVTEEESRRFWTDWWAKESATK